MDPSQAAPVASTSILPPALADQASNETTEESQSQSQSLPSSGGVLPLEHASEPRPGGATGELPIPIIKRPPASIPIASFPDSQQSQQSQYSQSMDIQNTQDALSPPSYPTGGIEPDVEGEEAAADSSFMVAESLIRKASLTDAADPQGDQDMQEVLQPMVNGPDILPAFGQGTFALHASQHPAVFSTQVSQ